MVMLATVTEAPQSTDVSGTNTPLHSSSYGGMGMGMGMGMAFPPMPSLPNLPHLPNGQGVSQAATEFLDAAHERVPTLSLNERRKFFHALAVVMFLPGVVVDVSRSGHPFSFIFYPELMIPLLICHVANRLAHTACLHPPRLLRRLRPLRVRRVRPLLCAVPRGRGGARVHGRVPGCEGSGHGGAEPLLFADGMCGGGVAGGVSVLFV
jgi:hypothetical protein